MSHKDVFRYCVLDYKCRSINFKLSLKKKIKDLTMLMRNVNELLASKITKLVR